MHTAYLRFRTSGRACRLALLLALGIIVAAGCARRELMPTPNLYVDAETDPFADVPPTRRTPDVDLLYVTDRRPEIAPAGRIAYGWERSYSVAYGSCVVEIGHDLTWEQLVAESRRDRRTRSLPLSLGAVREAARFPPTPLPLVREGDRIVEDPAAIEQAQELLVGFHDELRRRLAETRRKEVFVFVHGYHNTFEDAMFAAAELWHFLGREGVIIPYTWPAGSPGILRGYTHDRESGEFTSYHLRQFLHVLAACDDVERLHLIAHGRGNDVLLTAVRELLIESRVAGEDPRSASPIALSLLET